MLKTLPSQKGEFCESHFVMTIEAMGSTSRKVEENVVVFKKNVEGTDTLITKKVTSCLHVPFMKLNDIECPFRGFMNSSIHVQQKIVLT